MTHKAEEIRSLLNLFERSTWNEMRLETAGLKIAISKTGPLSTNVSSLSKSASSEAPASAVIASAVTAATSALRAAPAAVADALSGSQSYLRAPNLGVFWSKPKPDAPPFVVEGQMLERGDTVCVIEVMKLFTQVVAIERGRVTRVLVTDGTMVEHDTPLFVIQPT